MRRGLPHPWLPTPSGLCGLRNWVPGTSRHALWGGVVRPAEPEPHPSLECALPDDPTPKPFPRLVERASLPSSPPQQGPCLPPCGPPLVQEADVGIRPGPAQTVKQGRALQLRAVHPGALTPPLRSPPGRDGQSQAGGGPCRHGLFLLLRLLFGGLFSSLVPTLLLRQSAQTPEQRERGKQKP